MEIIAGIAGAHGFVQFGQTVQYPLLQLRHVLGVDVVGLSIMGQGTKHETHGVAQTAIAVSHSLQDLRADTQVGAIIGLSDPKAQDIGTILFGHILWADGVTQRFGHLDALFIQRKAMGQYPAIRCAAPGTASLQH